jgi:hypothetical protein
VALAGVRGGHPRAIRPHRDGVAPRSARRDRGVRRDRFRAGRATGTARTDLRLGGAARARGTTRDRRRARHHGRARRRLHRPATRTALGCGLARGGPYRYFGAPRPEPPL